MGEPADDDDEDNVRTRSSGALRAPTDAKSATRVEVPERQSKPRLENAPDFGSRYRVLGVLGKGGMGEVYRAYDTDLSNEVAIKIVRDDGASGAFQRFLREISLARKVTSPNVLRVYDLSEHAGLRFLTMELVEGEDLAALLKREPKLPRDRALTIFRQVCAGLMAAHKQGVVHRDLKPHNVLVDAEGGVRVCDFGLARSIADSGMTASGAVLGSPAYMSPEQVKGDPVDERSDIYSLGIMLYQLLGGETPFQADTPHGVMEMRLHKTPRPLREIDPQVPAHLEAVTARCLAVEPSARYRTVAELVAALDDTTTAPLATVAPVSPPAVRSRRPILLLGVGAIVAVGAAVFVAKSGETPAPPPAASPAPLAAPPTPTTVVTTANRIPVLIVNVDNRSMEPLFDGTVEVVLNKAFNYSTRLEGKHRGSLKALLAGLSPDAAITIEEAARKLAAQDKTQTAVVRSTVIARGTGHVLSVAVNDGATGKELFAGSAEVATLQDVVPALGKLATQIRTALGDKVTKEPPSHVGLSANVAAIHELVVAYGFINQVNHDAAIPPLERAIQLDPTFALAYMELGTQYKNSGRREKSREAYTSLLKHVDRLTDRDRLGYLADYYLFTTGEYDRAITVLRELLEQWPNSDTENNLGIAYLLRHDIPKAAQVFHRLAKENPQDMMLASNVADVELMATNLDSAIKESKDVLERFPNPNPVIHMYLGLAYALTGDTALAEEHYTKLEKGNAHRGALARADYMMARGRYDDASKLLRDTIKSRAKDGPAAVELHQRMLAEARLAAGDKAGALAAAAQPTKDDSNTYAVAMVQYAAGNEAAAAVTAKRLLESNSADARAYAKLLDATRESAHGKYDEALALVDEAERAANLWDVQLQRGRIALAAGKHAEALRSLEAAFARRGEGCVTADDLPLLRYVPQVTYFIGRTHEAQGAAAEAAKSYGAFLAMRPDAQRDLMTDDARKRLATVKTP